MNQKMDAIIIEDEKPSARRLNRMLDKLNVRVIKVLHSVEDSINWFQENKHPDIIFLDIQLSDGLSFAIFESVNINSAIIFTTAYDEYALQAFKLNSIDYLLKPIDDEELAAAVEKYSSFFSDSFGNNAANGNLINLKEIKRFLENPVQKEYKKRFTVKVGQHLKMVPIEDIECFYSENKATYLYTTEGRNYPVETSLEDLEHQVSPEDYYRVNRKFLVNLKAIKDIVAYNNSRFKLKLHHYREDEIIVARERVKAFKDWLG